MTHSTATIVAALLRSLEPITIPATAWTVYVSALPDKPDAAICVYDIAGRHDGRYMRTGAVVEHPGVEIRVRSMSYDVGWLKVNNIKETLDSLNNQVVSAGGSSYTIQSVSRKADALPMGQEPGTRRENFSLNIYVTLRGN